MSKKIVIYSENPQEFRLDFWKNQVPEIAGVEIQVDLLSEENFSSEWKKINSLYDGALISESQSDFLFQKSLKFPDRINSAHLMDSFWRDSAGVWMHLQLRDSLHQLIIEKAMNLDTQAVGYVTGAGSMMRMCVSVLTQIGYKKIVIVVENKDLYPHLISEIQKKYFGIDIKLIQNSDLTLQNNNGTILINTVQLVGKTDLIEDLTYLNFLFGDGLVVETNILPLHHQLIEESEQVGHHILRGSELFGHRDYSFLKKIIPGIKLQLKEYQTAWIKHLDLFYKNEK